jgi:hypothetical protein
MRIPEITHLIRLTAARPGRNNEATSRVMVRFHLLQEQRCQSLLSIIEWKGGELGTSESSANVMEESSDLVNMIIGQLKSGCLIFAKGTKVRAH